MARYINADRIDMNQVTVYDYKEQKWTHVFDIPEDIVRCKNCKHYGADYGTGEILPVCRKLEFTNRKEDDFCSWGERKCRD